MARGSKTDKRKNSNNGATLGFEEKLWQAADKMRGHMDPAEYKHVVLGLIFLKYISDVFEERRNKLQELVADPASEYYVEDPGAGRGALSGVGGVMSPFKPKFTITHYQLGHRRDHPHRTVNELSEGGKADGFNLSFGRMFGYRNGGICSPYRRDMRRPGRRVPDRHRQRGARKIPFLCWHADERLFRSGGRFPARDGRVLQDKRNQGRQRGRHRVISDTTVPGSAAWPGNLSQPGTSPTGHQDLRVEMHDLHLGLPYAGRDDHRSVESVPEAVPVRDLLLRAEKLPAVSGRGHTKGAGAKRHVIHRRGLGGRGRHLAPGTGRLNARELATFL